MSSTSPSFNPQQPSTEDLVAYLDGELDAQDSRSIEEHLARDEAARQQMQGLDRTWQLLETLPRAEATDDFTTSTVAMVAMTEGSAIMAARNIRARLARWGAIALSFVAAVSLGYVVGGRWLTDPNHQLILDLPVIERLDAYRQAGDIEFLRQLHQQGLFVDDEKQLPRRTASTGAPPAATAVPAATAEAVAPVQGRLGESFDERRLRVESMTPAQRDQLQRPAERFYAFDSNERDRLRALQAQVEADPSAAELLATLDRYHVWLRTLNPGERSQLFERDAAERIDAIVELRVAEEQAAVRLSIDEARGLVDWLEQRYLAQQTPERRQQLAETTPIERRLRLFWAMRQPSREQRNAVWPSMLTVEEIAELKSHLPPATQERLREVDTPEELRDILSGWYSDLFRRYMAREEFSPLLPPITDEQLTEFFTGQLSLGEQDELLALPPEEMWRQLRRLYMRAQLPDIWSRHREREGTHSSERGGERRGAEESTDDEPRSSRDGARSERNGAPSDVAPAGGNSPRRQRGRGVGAFF